MTLNPLGLSPDGSSPNPNTFSLREEGKGDSSMVFPRKPEPGEWRDLIAAFPSLDFGDVWITAPQTEAYNCLAWTLGITNRWIWPWTDPTVEARQFNELYRLHGFDIGTPAKVLGWGVTLSDMKHGSILYAGSLERPNLWESKLGQSWRITHSLDGLRGATYGTPLLNYVERMSGATAMVMPDETLPSLTMEEEAAIRETAAQVPLPTRLAFEAAFSAWRDTWRNPDVALSSNPATVMAVPEFRTLLEMGASILPLVVAQLMDPSLFFALQLYDELQRRYGGPVGRAQIIGYGPSDPQILEGEQGRCVRTLRVWLAAHS